MKSNELIGLALDWAVAKCEDKGVMRCGAGPSAYLAYIPKRSAYKIWRPSTNWVQGGPIIDRERMEVRQGNPLYFPKGNEHGDYYEPLWLAGKRKMHGPTLLIAAMRCYVASKLGDEVDIPEELQ